MLDLKRVDILKQVKIKIEKWFDYSSSKWNRENSWLVACQFIGIISW